METTIRRLNDHIYTLGTGVIAFAAWTLLKFTLYCTVYQNVLVEEMRVDLPADSSVLQVTIIAVWIIVFLDALFQCLIGFSARADGALYVFKRRAGRLHLDLVGHKRGFLLFAFCHWDDFLRKNGDARAAFLFARRRFDFYKAGLQL